jgi:hypothetical protein
MVYLYDACDQISDFCHQQLLRKMSRKISWTDGSTDRCKTVYPPPPSGNGGIINYGQIGDQTGFFYTINPVFYTNGNRFVRRTGTFGNLIFSLVPSDNRNTRSTCPTSVFTGTGQSDKR